jgi:hypothetical protein
MYVYIYIRVWGEEGVKSKIKRSCGKGSKEYSLSSSTPRIDRKGGRERERERD